LTEPRARLFEKFTSRYILEEKFEILITEQPIEHALAMIKTSIKEI